MDEMSISLEDKLELFKIRGHLIYFQNPETVEIKSKVYFKRG